jgi:regulatory protein
MSSHNPDPSLTTVRLAALDLLARREHSAQELREKLRPRFPAELIQTALDALREEGVQSDARFSEAYVHYRGSRGVGPLKIEQELRAKGIERALAREILYQSIDWEERCHDVLARKFPLNPKAPPAERARWLRFVAQRGFDAEQARAALRQLDQDKEP